MSEKTCLQQHKAEKQSALTNERQSLTGLRVICTTAGEWKLSCQTHGLGPVFRAGYKRLK